MNRSGRTLGEIVTAVKRVTDIVSEIAAASAEQSRGIEQVNGAVMQMDQVVLSNAAQTEELSSTAQNLTGQARELQELVRRFRVAEVAADAHRGHDAAAPRPKPQAALARREHVNRPKPPERTLAAARSANGSAGSWDADFKEF